MRALCLLLLCVVLLATMQASYLVAEAKKAHHESHVTDDAARVEDKHWKAKHHKKEHVQKEDKPEEKEDEDPVVPPVNDVEKVAEEPAEKENVDIYNQMQGDQGNPGDQGDQGDNQRSGRGERVSKEERRARKQERNERKQERSERRQGKKTMTDEEREAKKARRQEKKERRQEKKERKQKKQKSPCQSDSECADGECCMPSRRGEKFCKPNSKPRAVGDKCLTTCACEGELQCFMSATDEQSERRRNKKKQLGTCKTEAAEGDTPAN